VRSELVAGFFSERDSQAGHLCRVSLRLAYSSKLIAIDDKPFDFARPNGGSILPFQKGE